MLKSMKRLIEKKTFDQICIVIILIFAELSSSGQNSYSNIPDNSTQLRKVCESISIESKEDLHQLRGCSVIDGSIKIRHYNQGGEILGEESFPTLLEVRGFLLIYKVPGSIRLKTLFPNLYIVRGERLISRYSIVLYEVEELEDFEFPSLHIIERGSIFINGSEWIPNVDTCGVKSISAKDARAGNGEVLPKKIYVCSSSKIGECPSECKGNCDVLGRCCHHQCNGGCSSPWDSRSCFTCQNVLQGSQCRSTCTNSTYQVHHRCVPRDYCIDRGLLIVDHMNQCLFGEFCPTGYSKSVSFQSNFKKIALCNPCFKGAICPKICNGEFIKSMDEVTQFEGCEIINGSLTIRIEHKGLSSEVLESSLFAGLSSLKEVTGFIHIFRTQITTLDFLKGLQRIGGEELIKDRYAILVEDNSLLESAFASLRNETNDQLQIEKGDVLFQSNPRLCPIKIWTFVSNCVGKNITRSYQESQEGMVLRNRNISKNDGKISVLNDVKGRSRVDQMKKDGATSFKYSLDSVVRMRSANQHSVVESQVANQHRSFTNATNGSLGPCNVVSLNVSIKPSSDKGSFEIYHQKLENFGSELSFLIFYKKWKAFSDQLKSEFLSTCLEEWSSIGTVFNKSPSEKNVIQIPDMVSFSPYSFLIMGFPLKETGSLLKAQSEILHLRTPAYNPSPPVNVKSILKSPLTLEVSWGSPDRPNGVIDHYIVYISRIRMSLPSVARNCDFSSSRAQKKLELLHRSLFQKPDSNLEKSRSSVDCIESSKNFQNSIARLSVARQPSCFCDYDGASNEDDQRTSGCNATNKWDTRTILASNFINDQKTDDNKAPLAIEHYIPSYTDDDRREILVYGTNTSFQNLKYSGLYKIEVKACQRPAPCGNFGSIPCSSPKDHRKQSGNRHQPMIPLYKLCSLRNEVETAVVVKGNESLDLHLEARNNTRENGAGVEVFWSMSQDISSTKVLTSYVEIRNDTTGNILRRRYVGHSFRPSHQSAVVENLSTGHYSARVWVINTDGTLIPTKWISFYCMDEKSKRKIIMIRVLKVVIVIEMLIIALAYFMWRRIKSNRSFGSTDTLFKGEGLRDKLLPSIQFKEEMKLSSDQLEIHTDMKLGSGHFGNVYEATLKTGLGEFMKVAVKIPNQNATSWELDRFMKEPAILQNLSSHHVVKLLGVVSDSSPCLFVLEFLANRDLKTFLGKLKKQVNNLLPYKTLIRMACEAADGMAYLSSLNLVHKDLAARNCLVSDDDLTLKISDLGLAGQAEPYDNKEVFPYMPARWMAPESLKNKIFTSQTDVWSYGILLWEMSTGGRTPYEEIGHEQVAQNVISEGCSLPKPVLSIPPFETVMMKCWHYDPSYRPSFSTIFKYLIEFLEHDDRESLETVSYCCIQPKLQEGEESIFCPNENVENFCTQNERESCSSSQCLSSFSCQDFHKFIPPPMERIQLDNPKEIPSRMYCNVNPNQNFTFTTKFNLVEEAESCHSRIISSFHAEEPSVSRITECPQNTPVTKRLPELELSSSTDSSFLFENSSEKRQINDFCSRNFSPELNNESSRETKKMMKRGLVNRITERCSSSPGNKSLCELSPFKRLTDTYNVSSSKKRYFSSEDPESSVNLISTSESSVGYEVPISGPSVPFLRSTLPFIDSALPIYYCQCPTESERTFKHPLLSSLFSDKENQKCGCDYPLLSSQSSQALLNIHEKHLSLETENDLTNRLLTSECENV